MSRTGFGNLLPRAGWFQVPGAEIFEGWPGDPGLSGVGYQSALETTRADARPAREFPPGFEGANPGPSQPDNFKPRFRVRAGSSRCLRIQSGSSV